MKRQAAGLLAVTAVLLAARPAAPSQDFPPRVTLILNGLVSPLPNDFGETRTITLFAEDGSIKSAYKAKTGAGAEAALQLRLGERVAVIAGFAFAQRKSADTYSAELPHPLYLKHPRLVDGSLGGLKYLEMAGHLSLALTGGGDRFGYSLFAGPSFYQVEAEVIGDRVETRETYPYDTVDLTLHTVTLTKGAPGAHAGLGLSCAVGSRVALGAQARYGFARVPLALGDDETKVTAGGLEIGVGLRIGF